MSSAALPWILDVAAQIDPIQEPEEWKVARQQALYQINRQINYYLEVRAMYCSPDELVRDLANAEYRARRLTDPRWLPERPDRRMPSVARIVQYWVGRDPFHDLHLDQPRCFGCRRGTKAWSGSYFDRAHLVDRALGGLDHEGNIVLLCCMCHRVMPMFEGCQAEAALAWVVAGGWRQELATTPGRSV